MLVISSEAKRKEKSYYMVLPEFKISHPSKLGFEMTLFSYSRLI